jgi:spermidine/putrescine transport system ATP-binding protein
MQGTMEPSAVELREVTKRFADVVAVDSVELQIADGEFFSLLGPSGCGKTTTLRMIAGFETPTEGEVYIRGQPMGNTPPFRRDANMVFQNYALFPHMTVYQNVAFGLEMKGVQKGDIDRRVAEALEMVQMPGLADRKPSQLSGGQQQRVALARALINRPAVLLLDEPLGALDLKLRKQMQIELKSVQERVGITFIYVTHDQEEALTMSDRIAVMHRGQVLQVGRPVEIYEDPANRFVADFIGESNFLLGTVEAIGADWVTLDLAGVGQVRARRRRDLEAGERVTCAIRPEKMHLQREDPPADRANVAHGQITNEVYIGTDTQYLVRLGDGHVITVREQSPDSATAAFGRGEHIYVTWSADSTLILID